MEDLIQLSKLQMSAQSTRTPPGGISASDQPTGVLLFPEQFHINAGLVVSIGDPNANIIDLSMPVMFFAQVKHELRGKLAKQATRAPRPNIAEEQLGELARLMSMIQLATEDEPKQTNKTPKKKPPQISSSEK